VPEPALTDDITAAGLDAEVRRDLRGLQRDTADTVARHLVAAGRLVDEDPELALEHARFARARASRIAVVREAAGIAAYHAGEWAEALGELRAARRMGGGQGHLAVMADIERALGRPERALELSRGPEVRELPRAESIELAIVAAGARRDLGELDAAVVSLQIPELDPARRDPWSARLFFAYADNLLAAGREADALQWFVHAADADDDGETDAALRIAELTGEPLPEDDFAFGVEEESRPDSDGSDVAPEPDDEAADRDVLAADGPGAGDRPTSDIADAADSESAVEPSAVDSGTDSAPSDDPGTDTASVDTADADSAEADSAGPDGAGVASADADADPAGVDPATTEAAGTGGTGVDTQGADTPSAAGADAGKRDAEDASPSGSAATDPAPGEDSAGEESGPGASG
jgi:tetratricopeptide (TPR) repeat protein